MVQLASGWSMTVQRGPDWLFVQLSGPESGDLQDTTIHETLWSLLEQHLTYRLVLEMDEVSSLCGDVINQLVVLNERLRAQGGLLRICGLDEENIQTLRVDHPHVHFLHYRSREEAIMGHPKRPR